MPGTNKKLAEAVATSSAREGLQGDGVSSHLFDLLWKKDLLNSLTVSLRIPDTVLYRANAPSSWYFTSVDGTIKRKTKAKVNHEGIYKEFVRKASSSGIVAYYVTDVAAADGACEGEGARTTIEYFDLDGFRDFLFNRRERMDGILQKFIHPRGESNNMLRALWSPKVTLLERKINRRKVNDARYDLYERAATFEGPDFYSDVQPVRGSAMMQTVHDIAESAVEHVATVTRGAIQISRLALNFKTDHKDRLWLLFASSVRLQDEVAHMDKATRDELARQGLANTPLEMNVLHLPAHVRRIQSTSGRGLQLQKSCECPTCHKKVEPDAFCTISYSVLIEYDKQRRGVSKDASTELNITALRSDGGSAGEGSEDFPQVPEVFQKLHPRLTASEYDQFLYDATFLHREASVCESCFVEFSSPQLGQRCFQNRGHIAAVEDDGELLDEHSMAKQELQPDRLRARRLVTADKISAEKNAEHMLWDAQAARMDKLKRIHSCPKLAMADYAPGPRLWPPPPLLNNVPNPPQEQAAGPHFNFHFGAVQRSASSPSLRRAPKHVPPLRSDGDPYLKEVQGFVAVCEDRAVEVLGAKGAKTYARAASRKVNVSLPALPARPTPGAAATAAEDARDAARTVWEVGAAGSREAAQHDLAEADVDVHSESDYGAEADSKVAASSELARYLPWRRGKLEGGNSGADTPTTQTPSSNETPMLSLLASRAGSRPSSRTSSRAPLSSRRQLGELPPPRAAVPRPASGARGAGGLAERSGLPRPGGLERPVSLRDYPQEAVLGN